MHEARQYTKLENNGVKCSLCNHRCTIQPRTLSYSLGSIGCNFHCEHCQNWHISRAAFNEVGSSLRSLSPEEEVTRAIENRCASISWTYNEPAIWHEYPLDMGTIARTKGLGMHIETVTLVIPGHNDSPEEMERLICWVVENLDPDMPMHFSAFHPDYRMTDRGATPVGTLEKIYELAKRLGVRYPYLGNVRSSRYENTHCPSCGTTLIERQGFATRILMLDGTQCRICGEKIAIVR